MPGSISDSYDPEFGTAEAAGQVRDAIVGVRQRVTNAIGSDQLADIVGVARADDGPRRQVWLSERELRLIRFGLDRSIETL